MIINVAIVRLQIVCTVLVFVAVTPSYVSVTQTELYQISKKPEQRQRDGNKTSFFLG
jgi:hypothetical protein